MFLCTLGDALLDVVVRPALPVRAGDDVPAQAHAGAGGQAANVAAWAVELEADARVVAKRADDATAALVEAELDRRGVELVGPRVKGRTGVVVSLLGPEGERSLLSDRGVCSDLRPEELEMTWFLDCDALHLSGYALVSGPMDEAAARAAGAVTARGGRVSVDLGTRTAIESFGPRKLLSRLEQLAPGVVFAGEQELDGLGSEPPTPVLVVKRGPRGFTVVQDGRATDFDALEGPVADTTGAGDAFAAGFLVGGPELARQAAARCVSRLGAMP